MAPGAGPTPPPVGLWLLPTTADPPPPPTELTNPPEPLLLLAAAATNAVAKCIFLGGRYLSVSVGRTKVASVN